MADPTAETRGACLLHLGFLPIAVDARTAMGMT
jgi:hypothetical protein